MAKKHKLAPLKERSESDDTSDSDEGSFEVDEDLMHKASTAANGAPANLNASETESDVDDDVDDEDSDDDDDNNEDSDGDAEMANAAPTKSRIENIRESIKAKYAPVMGKQLFIRFPQKLPLDVSEFEKQVHALTPLIVKAHKPRQRYARFCIVEFATTDDRNVFFAHIQKAAAKKNDKKYAGIVAGLPRFENNDFLEELVQKKLRSIKSKREKARLRKAANKAENTKSFTSTIVILNLPTTAVIADVRKLFPNAVDIQMRPPRGRYHGPNVAAVTFPTTMDARVAKTRKLTMNDTKLIVKFALENERKKNKKNNKKLQKKEEAKGPVASSILQNKKFKILGLEKFDKEIQKDQQNVGKAKKIVIKKLETMTLDKNQKITKKAENLKQQKNKKNISNGETTQPKQQQQKGAKTKIIENSHLVQQITKKPNKQNVKIENSQNKKQNNKMEPIKQQKHVTQNKTTKMLGGVGGRIQKHNSKIQQQNKLKQKFKNLKIKP